ncbi:MAG: hypothetical protein ACPGD8_06720 [Flavobacteriales bacterium]
MKSLGILGLALAFVIQMMSASLILVNYEVNTAYIIENFCENTDKPELHCDGKCHLKKQIEADSEQKSETPSALTEIVTFVLAVEEVPSFELDFFSTKTNTNNSLYLEGSYSNHLQSIFHPPQV